MEILDNLVWRSLTTDARRFAQGGGLARRFDPEVAGFVGVEDSRRSVRGPTCGDSSVQARS